MEGMIVDEATEAEPIGAIATTSTQEESVDEAETIEASTSTADRDPESVEEKEIQEPIHRIHQQFIFGAINRKRIGIQIG